MRKAVTPIQLVGLGVHPTSVLGQVSDRVFHAFGGFEEIRMAVGCGRSPRESADNAISAVKQLAADGEKFNVETDLGPLSRVEHLDPSDVWYLFMAIMIKPARNRASP